jgi:two-component system, sensor histidine kinase and response regulator
LPEQIQDCVDRGDLVAASRHAHSLKGAAANLAMPGVARSAAELETALKDQAPAHCQAKCAALKTALTVVLDSLNQLVSAAEPTESSGRMTPAAIMPEAPEPALNRAAAREGLAKLREQIAAGDLDAAKELSNLEVACGTHFRAELEALRQHLDAFDFEQANRVVEALETQLREV